MQRFLHVFKKIRVKKSVVVFAAGYLFFVTASLITSPTNASFTDKTTISGLMEMKHSFTEDICGEKPDDPIKESPEENREKQEKAEEDDTDNSSDEARASEPDDTGEVARDPETDMEVDKESNDEILEESNEKSNEDKDETRDEGE